MSELIQALSELKNTELIFTMPNADTEGRVLIEMIEKFVSSNPNAHCYTSLGQLRYFSTLAIVDGVVGNSSSSLAEVPTFRRGTINIGDRQLGRLKATSVIDCEPNKISISNLLKKLYSKSFQQELNNTINHYGEGGSVEKIIKIIKSVSLNDLIKKRFFNIEF